MGSVFDFISEWSAPALLFLISSTTVIPAIKKAMLMLEDALLRGQKYAAQYTPKWKGDDRFFAFAIRAVDASVVGLDYLFGFLEVVLRLVRLLVDVVPVVTVGRANRPPRHDDRGSGIGGVPMLVLAALMALASGCAKDAQVRDARLVRWDFILGGVEYGLLDLGEFLRPFYDSAEAQCATDLDEYDECIRGWETTIDIVAHAYYDVQVTRAGLAIGTGADAIPCLVRSIQAALAAVVALPGVELPPKYETAIGGGVRALAAVVGGECVARVEE